jgi:hypothetical protein
MTLTVKSTADNIRHTLSLLLALQSLLSLFAFLCIDDIMNSTSDTVKNAANSCSTRDIPAAINML